MLQRLGPLDGDRVDEELLFRQVADRGERAEVDSLGAGVGGERSPRVGERRAGEDRGGGLLQRLREVRRNLRLRLRGGLRLLQKRSLRL